MPFDNEKVLFDFVKSRLQVGDTINDIAGLIVK